MGSANYQHRDKFFFASPGIFPGWPYKLRLAIGMKLNDFWARESKVYRFQVNGTMYEIEKEKARRFGTKYQMKFGALPNIIPLEEFQVVDQQPVGEKSI